MKQIAFYRRSGRPGVFRGLKERVTWMIQSRGRPVTGSEIAEKFGVSLCEFNKVARSLTKGSKVVKIRLQSHSPQTPESLIAFSPSNQILVVTHLVHAMPFLHSVAEAVNTQQKTAARNTSKRPNAVAD